MPSKSPAQHRLMEAAAHTKGGFGGVPQKVGKEFVAADKKMKTGGVVKSLKKAGFYEAGKNKAERIDIINDVTTKPQRLEMVDKLFSSKKMKGGGLYENIHAKRQRISEGSGEKMRRAGSKGAPTAEAFKQSAKTVKKQEGGAVSSATDMSRLRRLEEDQKEHGKTSTKVKSYVSGALNLTPFLRRPGDTSPGPKEYESKGELLRQSIASEREAIGRGDRDYAYKPGNKLPEGMIEKKAFGGKVKKSCW